MDDSVDFFLGTHQPSWLRRTGVPLFLSTRRLAERRNLPRALGRVAIDSGGYSELSMFGGWRTSAREYVAEVRRYARDLGSIEWAAIQDWMCEPWILQKTGLGVAEHQARTVASLLELRTLAPEVAWAPVLQGWESDDFLRHIDTYQAAGVDLFAEKIVGVGSVCRRQATAPIEALLRHLAGLGLRLHGFGFKKLGLLRAAAHLTSSDSMAWSFQARRLRRAVCGSTAHRNCANCLSYALEWRSAILRQLAPTR